MSGRHYQTLSIGRFCTQSLEIFLQQLVAATPTSLQQQLQCKLRQKLLNMYNHYLNIQLSQEQKNASLIACFLHPFTYGHMNDHDKKKAEELITKELKTRASLNSSSISLSSSALPAASSPSMRPKTKESNSVFDQLLLSCGISSPQSAPIKSFTIKQEISYYISSITKDVEFESYWCAKRRRLPQLQQLVQTYNIMPATSVASEFLFSIAGYVNHKQRSSLSSRTSKYSMLLRDQHIVSDIILTK